MPGSGQFPVVGVGASAGGLEAFTLLLKSLPANPGMAFVLIQHLSPAHESLLSELLSKVTSMPVREVTEGMAVEPDSVYVIPPDTEMAVLHGALHLMPREESRQHMPVDSFLRSLAEDRRDGAIAIVLSGTGSDGSAGVRAVKGEGGIVLAQDATAKYDGMPKSAIATGCVDYVLPPDKIADELLRIRRHPYLARARAGEAERTMPEEAGLDRIFVMLRAATGVDFTSYKRTTIMRRVVRRMLLRKVEKMEDYVSYLKDNPSEAEALYQDILINVTSFFREPGTFDALKASVFPHIVRKASPDVPIRIWVPACSTGEEAYSVVISLLEYMFENKVYQPVQVFATDIDEDAVDKARKGAYPENISRDVSPERLDRFFVKTDSGYMISKAVREACVFARHNIVRDPPFSKIDLISCRNLLIYFGPDLQKKVARILSYALVPKGFLMVGTSETVGDFSDSFSVVDKKNRIYSRRPVPARPLPDATRPGHVEEKAAPGDKAEARLSGIADIQREADAIVLERYSPAGFVVGDGMKILQFRGDTSPYLRPAHGEASLNLLKMVREELAAELSAAIHQARKGDDTVRREGSILTHNGRAMHINIDVAPFKVPSSGERSFLVLFEESPAQAAPEAEEGRRKKAAGTKRAGGDGETARLRQELAAAKVTLKSVSEEHEAANEEFKALNEELQSSNEEMQSVNEELETAREELQSTNEELTTVNDELLIRNEEMTTLSDDLANILRGVEIPIVLLGQELQIRRFNDAAAGLLNLIQSDIGRPISDIRSKLDVPDLGRIVRGVVDTLAIETREARDADGRWYSLVARPYKTMDHRIGGALVTIFDITELKASMGLIDETRKEFQDLYDNAPSALFSVGTDGIVHRANRYAVQMLGHELEELIGKPVLELYADAHEGKEKAMEMFRRFKAGEEVSDEELMMQRVDGTPVWVSLTVNPVRDSGGRILESRSMVMDITERKRLKDKLEKTLAEKELLLREVHHRVKNNMIVIVSLLKIQSRALKDPAAIELIREAQNRVNSMMRIYEKLYQSPDLTNVNFNAYIRDLTTDLFSSYDIDPAKIAFELDISEVPIDIEKAIPCGLIINELISNAVKHGFPGGRSGKVGVSISQGGSGEVELVVKDDGAGLPEGVDISEATTWGLQLVRMLVQQIGGVLEQIKGGGGTEFRVRFKTSEG